MGGEEEVGLLLDAPSFVFPTGVFFRGREQGKNSSEHASALFSSSSPFKLSAALQRRKSKGYLLSLSWKSPYSLREGEVSFHAARPLAELMYCVLQLVVVPVRTTYIVECPGKFSSRCI